MDITTYALLLKKLKTKANLVDGKIPSSELPSYVDDVIEYESISNFPQEGEEGKIYVALDTGYTYRWSGSQYIQIGGQDLSLILNNFADFYDEQSTYEENDLVIYEETLYKCKQDISVAESFDSNHWDAVTVEELLDEKQDTLISGTNIKTINSTSVLGSGDIDTKELFECVYGITTYAQITQALSDGKLPVCIYSGRLYKYDLKSPTDRYIFNTHYSDAIYTLNVQANNTWGAGSTQFEITANKVTSISSDSTNSQYAAAKAVYDYAQPVLVNGTNIKSINGNSLLGSGNIDTGLNIPTVVLQQYSSGSIVSEENFNILTSNRYSFIKFGTNGRGILYEYSSSYENEYYFHLMQEYYFGSSISDGVQRRGEFYLLKHNNEYDEYYDIHWLEDDDEFITPLYDTIYVEDPTTDENVLVYDLDSHNEAVISGALSAQSLTIIINGILWVEYNSIPILCHLRIIDENTIVGISDINPNTGEYYSFNFDFNEHKMYVELKTFVTGGESGSSSLIESEIEVTITPSDVDLASVTSDTLPLTSSGEAKVLPLFQKARELLSNDKLGLMQIQQNAVDLSVNYPLIYVSGSTTLNIYENFQLVGAQGTELALKTDGIVGSDVAMITQLLSNDIPLTMTVTFYKQSITTASSGSQEYYDIEVADDNDNKAKISISKETFDAYIEEMNQVGEALGQATGNTWTDISTIAELKDLFDDLKGDSQLSFACDLAMNLLVKYAYESGENPVIYSSVQTYATIVAFDDYNLNENYLGTIFSLNVGDDPMTNSTVRWFKNTAIQTDQIISIDENATFTYEERNTQGGSGGNAIPTVTITLSQVISQDPVIVQLTQAQLNVFAGNPIVSVDASELGLGTSLFYKGVWDSTNGYYFASKIFGTYYNQYLLEFGISESDVTLYAIDIDTPTISPTRIATGDNEDAGKIIVMDSDGYGQLTPIKTINNQSIFGTGNILIAQDLTSIITGTLDSTAWNNLKTNHYYTISSPTMTGLSSDYEFVNIKLSINSNNQFVKLSKNTTDKYSGLFFIEESTNLYEITVYYNGTNIILRCATVM